MRDTRQASARFVEAHARGEVMAFFVGLFLFVLIVGVLDSRLGWPSPERGRRQT